MWEIIRNWEGRLGYKEWESIPSPASCQKKDKCQGEAPFPNNQKHRISPFLCFQALKQHFKNPRNKFVTHPVPSRNLLAAVISNGRSGILCMITMLVFPRHPFHRLMIFFQVQGTLWHVISRASNCHAHLREKQTLVLTDSQLPTSSGEFLGKGKRWQGSGTYGVVKRHSGSIGQSSSWTQKNSNIFFFFFQNHILWAKSELSQGEFFHC